MKNVLFKIFVALMTPIYFIITVLKIMIEFITYTTEPFAELISEIIENMTEFWKKVFKVKE